MSTFAVASPAHMLESRAPDDLVLLLAIQQTSALVYPARRSAGIRSLADLAGRRVGVWPGREDLEFRWMLQRAGVDPAAVSFVPMNDTVAGLCDGVVDCAQMTSYHEIHHLQHKAGSLDDFTLFSAADHGAALLKDGLIARRDWVAGHLAETQAAIDAVLKGWTLAFTDASAAVEACLAARPDMSEAEHRRQLADIRALAMTGATRSQGLGYPDPLQVARAAEALSAVHGEPAASLRRRVRRTRGSGPPRPRRFEAAPCEPARIIVVGAGVVGAAVAEALSRDGHDVTIIEQGSPGGAVSGGDRLHRHAYDGRGGTTARALVLRGLGGFRR